MRYRVLIFTSLLLLLILGARSRTPTAPRRGEPARASRSGDVHVVAAGGEAVPAALAAVPIREDVLLDTGPIQGRPGRSEGVLSYRGIPYAAPPIGVLRWRSPQPVVPWTEARLCTAFSAICPQPRPLFYRPGGRQSEDCLYLNVWTAARTDAEARPVLVWIHGGSFAIGAGSRAQFDGDALATEGAVVVTFNYRLGPFGFLAHPALSAESTERVSGNYGLLDQIAALEWVRRNIRAFGGNPDNVTLFGQSAGAASVARLMVSPGATGLFHRAILHSGGVHGRLRRLRETTEESPSAEAVGLELATRLGCDEAADPVAALRAVTAERLVETANPAQGLFGEGTRFQPVVDGLILPDDPARLWEAGRELPIPLLIGTCENEGSMFVAQLGINRGVTYRQALTRLFGERAAEIEKAYPVRDKAQMRERLDLMLTATRFLRPAREMAGWHAARAPVWRFHFTRVNRSAWVMTLGAHHGAEIPYVFGTLDPKNSDADDAALGQRMRATWVRFAATGRPDADGLPEWAPYDIERDNYLEFGSGIRAGAGLQTDTIAFLRSSAKK